MGWLAAANWGSGARAGKHRGRPCERRIASSFGTWARVWMSDKGAPAVEKPESSFEVENAASGRDRDIDMMSTPGADNPLYQGGKGDASESPRFNAADWDEPNEVKPSDAVFEEEPSPEEDDEDGGETVSKLQGIRAAWI